MKQMILGLALVIASCTSAFAGNGLTRAQNDSLIQVGHQALATKTAQFQSSLQSHNMTAAQTASAEIMTLMRTAMTQGMTRIILAPTADKARYNQIYLNMETFSHEYRQLAGNVPANGTQLLSKANAFLQVY